MDSGRSDKITSSHANLISYPQRERRYWRTWWNSNAQDCYTESDTTLLTRINKEYTQLQDGNTKADFFSLTENKHWHDWWVCATPTQEAVKTRSQGDSFTLPIRESKDSKVHPLWDYANNMARRIANWQSERAKNQDARLINDPVMLVFEELRDWFYHTLAEKECKKEVLDHISKRQSYIKSLIHLIPDFGPDKLHLHAIQQSLDDATKTVRSCIANKELPQLLSDLIISGKSLESTLGNYLHLLLIDEEVADNFSLNYIEDKQKCSVLSPVCKIYHAIETAHTSQAVDVPLQQFQAVSKFYDIVKITDDSGSTQLQLRLKERLTNLVKFASFTNSNDRNNYLEAIAALEALINVRKTLEKHNNVQVRIGTYIFAMNYLEKANSLATHYINLIAKSKRLIKELIHTADDGLKTVLGKPNKTGLNKYFQKNLRALETRVAKGTTVSAQLDIFSQNAAESMHKYQIEMQKLVSSINSGEASHEIELVMRELYVQMNHLDSVLPAVLDDSVLITNQTEPETALCLPTKAEVDSCEVAQDEHKTISAPSTDLIHLDTGQWEITNENNDKSPVFILKLFSSDKPVGALEFYGELADIKTDNITNQPIYVYRYYDNHVEIGSAEFYGQPGFCVSADRQSHNIIKITGILSHFKVSDEKLALENNICSVLPPSLLQNILHSAGQSALHGVFRGGANAVADKVSNIAVTRQVLSQLTYLGCVFSWKFSSHYSQVTEEEKAVNSLGAMYKAAWAAAFETGQIALFSIGFNALGSLLQMTGNALEEKNWTKTGKSMKMCGKCVRFGFFAYDIVGKNLSSPEEMAKAAAVTAASIASGTVAEIATEKAVKIMM